MSFDVILPFLRPIAHLIQDPGLELYSSFWQFLEKRVGRAEEPARVVGVGEELIGRSRNV